MWRKLLWLAIPALLVVFVRNRSEAVEGKIKVVVQAKAAGKLAAPLTALKLSGGTLVGQTRDGGVVVEVAAPSFAAAQERITKAGATKVLEKIPDKVEKMQRLILGYKKGAAPSAADLKRIGFKVIDQNEEGGLLLVEATGAITADTVAALEKHPDITHIEPEQTVGIPK